METSSIVLLAVSTAVSFGLGRTFMHFRRKKQKEEAQEREARALRDRPVEPESKNKSKRKRQLQQIEKGLPGQKR
ncbi:MAG: hypothetical protein GZ092_01090 [Polaromonas sp.]|nr:hypothetical protein [Polaromonas sp.]